MAGAKKTYDPDLDEAGREGREPQDSPVDGPDPRLDLDPVDREVAAHFSREVLAQLHSAGGFRKKFDKFAAIHAQEFLELEDAKAVVFPIIQTAISELKTLISNALFPTDRYMEYAPGEPGTQWQQTETMTQIVLDGFRKADLHSTVEDELLDDWMVFGTAIEEICFDLSIGHRVARDRQMEVDLDESGELQIEEVEVEAEANYLLRAQGEILRVDPRQMVFSQLYGRRLEDQDWVAKYDAVTWDYLYTNRERVEEVVIGGERVHRKIGGRFRDVPKRELARMIPSTGLEEDPAETTSETGLTGGEQSSRVNGFRILEVYWRGDFEGLLFRKGANGDLKFTSAQLRAWRERHGLTEEDMRPGAGWFRITLLPDFDWVIEIRRNPNPRDQLPYRISSRKPRKGCLYGIGVYEEFWPTQASANAIFRAADDSVKKICDPMYGIPKQTFDTSRGALGDILRHRGGKLIGLTFGFAGSVSNPMIPIHPPVESPELAERWLQFVEHSIRSKMGVPPQPGQVVGDRGSATEASLVMSKASEILKGMIKRFERQMLRPAYDQIRLLYQMFVTLPMAVMMHSRERAQYYAEIVEPSMFAGEMRAVSLASTQIAENPVRAQQLINMVGQIAGFAQESGVTILNTRGAIEEVVRMMELNISPERILKTREQVAEELKMLARQQQIMAQHQAALAGGGEGGGQNPAGNQGVIQGLGDITSNRAGGQVVV